jgi:hypothetical protein
MRLTVCPMEPGIENWVFPYAGTDGGKGGWKRAGSLASIHGEGFQYPISHSYGLTLVMISPIEYVETAVPV